VFIDQWLRETVSVSAYFAYTKQSHLAPVAFALLSKYDFDPISNHPDSNTLSFLHTPEQSRNRGFATALLRYLNKQRPQANRSRVSVRMLQVLLSTSKPGLCTVLRTPLKLSMRS
jgi:hypothetical protein